MPGSHLAPVGDTVGTRPRSSGVSPKPKPQNRAAYWLSGGENLGSRAPQERRIHPRLTVQSVAEVRGRGGFQLYSVADLSVGGARLLGPQGLIPGETVEVSFSLPGVVTLAADAIILWATTYEAEEVGIRFTMLPAEVEDYFDALVRAEMLMMPLTAQ